ncbi:Uncharacterised protein [Klebsiella pneumoniae]|nr:Uncharacterised protein [Klebsiella pneumoniae]
MMNNNNLQHNQFFTIEQDFSPDKLLMLSALLWSASVIFMQTGPMKKT